MDSKAEAERFFSNLLSLPLSLLLSLSISLILSTLCLTLCVACPTHPVLLFSQVLPASQSLIWDLACLHSIMYDSLPVESKAVGLLPMLFIRARHSSWVWIFWSVAGGGLGGRSQAACAADSPVWWSNSPLRPEPHNDPSSSADRDRELSLLLDSVREVMTCWTSPSLWDLQALHDN